MIQPPKMITCPNCGKLFTPWRKKAYCSERCRKRAEDTRRYGVSGGIKGLPATTLPEAENSVKLAKQNQVVANPFRGDEGFEWTACNEVTHKLLRSGSREAVAWVMRIDRDYYGRIDKDFSFGPTSLSRARGAVEARLMGQDFEKYDDEKSWSGDCMDLLCPQRST